MFKPSPAIINFGVLGWLSAGLGLASVVYGGSCWRNHDAFRCCPFIAGPPNESRYCGTVWCGDEIIRDPTIARAHYGWETGFANPPSITGEDYWEFRERICHPQTGDCIHHFIGGGVCQQNASSGTVCDESTGDPGGSQP
jgi:hypothetical protein